MDKVNRAALHLEEILKHIEMLVSSKKPLTEHRALYRMRGNLRDVVNRMHKVDKCSYESRKKFWKMSRRAVDLSAKILNLLNRA